jgi:hypothetical protein
MGGFRNNVKAVKSFFNRLQCPQLVVGPRGKNAKEAEDNFNEARGLFALSEGGR